MAYSNTDDRGGGSGCLLWFGDLTDMRYTNDGQDLYIRIAASELDEGKRSSTNRVVVIVLPVLAVTVILVLLLLYAFRKRKLERIASSQGEDYNAGLVQTLHDAARVFELAIKEKSSKSKTSWFSTAWLGVDRNSWVKALSYQASVYSLLQSGCEILSRGDGRDRDINVFVQRSLLRQSAHLVGEIRLVPDLSTMVLH
ncbi:hypothetical protein POM88_052790 [Heracleum sosnowskyi]|uniref:Uncharacterized protein n=1 Tax=Heracleum sosnowskyi TaxID=360622 RepID=A0AAD8LY97_9APIA|nr:hypothetical protein POM88_052790 [Heracleum sosnowskyi]